MCRNLLHTIDHVEKPPSHNQLSTVKKLLKLQTKLTTKKGRVKEGERGKERGGKRERNEKEEGDGMRQEQREEFLYQSVINNRIKHNEQYVNIHHACCVNHVRIILRKSCYINISFYRNLPI